MGNSNAASNLCSELIRNGTQKDQENKFEGFEFLRAIFSIAIVALKTNLFLLVEILFSANFSYMLMASFSYLAVPVFLQISLFLFYLKSDRSGFLYFLKKRLPRLVSLYCFWVGLKIVSDIVLHGQLQSIKNSASSPENLVEFIVSGAQSPFFFFFSLIALSTLAAALTTFWRTLKKTSKKVWFYYWFLFISLFLVFFLSVIELLMNTLSNAPSPALVRSMSNIAFWDYNVINFLPYLFTTAIVLQEFYDGKLRRLSFWLELRLGGLLFLFLFFTALEWHLFGKLLHYARLSLVFGSWFLLYVALLSSRKAPPIVKFLAASSLGIYGFHVLLYELFLGGDSSILGRFLQNSPGFYSFFGFAIVLVGAIILTTVSKRMKGIKKYV